MRWIYTKEALLENRGTTKFNRKLKHTFNGGEKDLIEQNTKHKTLH